MKIHVCTLLLLVTLTYSAEVITFGEGAVNSIFKEKKEAVILFSNGNGDEVQSAFVEAASSD